MTVPPPILSWGLALIEGLHSMRSTGLDAFFRLLSHLADEPFILASVPLAFVLARRAWAGRFALSIVGVAWLTEVVKLLVAEPRPEFYAPGIALAEARGFGMPSGHAAFAVVFFGLLAAATRRPAAVVTAALLAFGVGVSRVYLGVHFPTDVLAGWLLGALFLCASSRSGTKVQAALARIRLPWRLTAAVAVPPVLLLFGIGPETISILAASQGALIGLALGSALLREPDAFARGPTSSRILRAALAILAAFAVSTGLKAFVGSAEPEVLWRWIRYATVGLTISLIVPLACTKMRLTPAPKKAAP